MRRGKGREGACVDAIFMIMDGPGTTLISLYLGRRRGKNMEPDLIFIPV
jgi:hypothetical protein